VRSRLAVAQGGGRKGRLGKASNAGLRRKKREGTDAGARFIANDLHKKGGRRRGEEHASRLTSRIKGGGRSSEGRDLIPSHRTQSRKK